MTVFNIRFKFLYLFVCIFIQNVLVHTIQTQKKKNKKKTFKNRQKTWIDSFPKTRNKWPKSIWGTQNCSSSEKCKLKPQWDIISHLSECLLSKRPQITNVGKDVGKRKTLYTDVGRQIGIAAVETVWKFLKTLKIETITWFINSTLEYTSKENKSTNSKRYMHPNVLSSTIYNCQDMKAT